MGSVGVGGVGVGEVVGEGVGDGMAIVRAGERVISFDFLSFASLLFVSVDFFSDFVSACLLSEVFPSVCFRSVLAGRGGLGFGGMSVGFTGSVLEREREKVGDNDGETAEKEIGEEAEGTRGGGGEEEGRKGEVGVVATEGERVVLRGDEAGEAVGDVVVEEGGEFNSLNEC